MDPPWELGWRLVLRKRRFCLGWALVDRTSLASSKGYSVNTAQCPQRRSWHFALRSQTFDLSQTVQDQDCIILIPS